MRLCYTEVCYNEVCYNEAEVFYLHQFHPNSLQGTVGPVVLSRISAVLTAGHTEPWSGWSTKEKLR